MPMVLIAWLVISFAGVSKNISGSKPFTQDQTLALRGICALEIMLGHIGLATGSMILYPNRKAGILFVGIFFVLSGYGVAYSADHKEGYLKHFLSSRVLKILVPAYFIKLIMIVIQFIVLQCLGKPCTTVSLWGFFIEQNWYVWEQLLFYLFYWLACKIFPKHIEKTVGIISVVFVVLAFVSGMDNPWYGSALCFALGLHYYRFERSKSDRSNTGKTANKGQNRNKLYYMSLTVLGFVLMTAAAGFIFLGNSSILGNPVARNAASLSFCLIVILLLYKFRIGNPVSRFLGRCSYEIFLVHPYVLVILGLFNIGSTTLIGLLTIALSIVFAYGVHWIFTWVLAGGRK